MGVCGRQEYETAVEEAGRRTQADLQSTLRCHCRSGVNLEQQVPSVLAGKKHVDKNPLDFQVGDIVLIKDENLLDKIWPMAIMTSVYPGKDGLVRLVNIRARGKSYKCTTDRLVLLMPAGDDGGEEGEHVRAPTALSSDN